MSIITIIFSFLFHFGCQKDIIIIEPTEPPISTPGIENKLEVVWQTSLGVVDTSSYLNEGVVIANDKVIATPYKPNK